MNIKKTEILTEKNFKEYSIWYFEEHDDSYYPVEKPDELLSKDPKDIRMKVRFYTSSKLSLDGYIVGIEDIFSIGIFFNGKKFRFNKNLPDLSLKQCKELISNLPSELNENIKNFFPLSFETDFDWEEQGYHNFSGTFDAFEKVRDKINKNEFK